MTDQEKQAVLNYMKSVNDFAARIVLPDKIADQAFETMCSEGNKLLNVIETKQRHVLTD